MIGFYFVVKKNSWNILVKIAKPPDYTLMSYSSLKSWNSHTHGTRKNGPRKNGPRNGLQKHTHTTTMLDPQPTIFRFWLSRGPIFWDQFFGDHFSGTNFPGPFFLVPILRGPFSGDNFSEDHFSRGPFVRGFTHTHIQTPAENDTSRRFRLFWVSTLTVIYRFLLRKHRLFSEEARIA